MIEQPGLLEHSIMCTPLVCTAHLVALTSLLTGMGNESANLRVESALRMASPECHGEDSVRQAPYPSDGSSSV